VLYVEDIPNSALSKENIWYSYITSLEASQLNTTTIGDVRLQLKAKINHYRGLNSHVLYQLGQKHGLGVLVTTCLDPKVSQNGLSPSPSQLGSLRAIFYKKSQNSTNYIQDWLLNTEREHWKRIMSMSNGKALFNRPYDPAFQTWFEGEIQEKIIASLRLNLLPYAVPSEYMFLLELPRLPNGKLNRNALALSVVNRGSLKARRVRSTKHFPPSDSYEKEMVNLWEEELNTSNVSMRDSFQDLGGNSLILTFLRNRIARLWKVNLSFGDLWDLKTPQEMVKRIKFEMSISE